eukprot:gb/GEZN01002164.1/.p1 GENE.gb/GEZN01002164.1/~~gb/GEZN01002164.1/.p1  ORF type:complete len:663 (+),score=116.47 gb/GEZN01002164.1/:66-2054(+)
MDPQNEEFEQSRTKILSRMFDVKENDEEMIKLIRATLAENEWEPEDCIVPLFSAIEKRKEEQRTKELQQQREQEKKKNKDQAMRFLGIMFQAFSPEEILRVLEENDGDVDATTEHFLAIVQKKDQDTKKRPVPAQDYRAEQLQRERKFQTDALCQRFHEFSREQIIEKLQECDYDSDTTIEALVSDRAASRTLRLSTIIDRAPKPFKNKLPIEDQEASSNSTEIQEVKKIVLQSRNDTDSALFKQELEKTIRGPYTDQLFQLRKSSETKECVQSPPVEEKHEKTEKSSIHPARISSASPSPAPSSKHAPQEHKTTPDKVDELLSPAPPTTTASASVASADSAATTCPKALTAPSQMAEGESIEVSWDFVASGIEFTPTAKDYIGIYWEDDVRTGGPYVTYHWTYAKPKGVLSFRSPGYCGSYVFQYVTNSESGLKCIAASPPVQVGASFQLKVVKPSTQQTMPMEVSVVIEQSSPKMVDFPATGWIALYSKTDKEHRPTDKSYVDYQWVAAQSKVVESEAKDGLHRQVRVLPYSIPKAGIWEFRFFAHKAYRAVSRLTLNLTGQDTVQLVVEGDKMIVNCKVATVNPATDPVWIGIFHSSEENPRQYRRCKYISEAGVTTLTFKKCIHTGTYEARLFANRSFDVLATSEQVHVDGVEGSYWL